MRIRLAATTTALLAVATLLASDAEAQMASSSSSGDAVTSALTSQFETVSGYLLSAAEQVPEADYSYQPTEEVRTLGGMLAHVAQAHYAFCSGASGEEMPSAAGDEASTKSQIVDKLRASRDYCLQVYGQTSGDDLGDSASLFGNESTRGAVLIQNMGHDQLHYGNIVTYMRSIGMVPPSSQGG